MIFIRDIQVKYHLWYAGLSSMSFILYVPCYEYIPGYSQKCFYVFGLRKKSYCFKSCRFCSPKTKQRCMILDWGALGVLVKVLSSQAWKHHRHVNVMYEKSSHDQQTTHTAVRWFHSKPPDCFISCRIPSLCKVSREWSCLLVLSSSKEPSGDHRHAVVIANSSPSVHIYDAGYCIRVYLPPTIHDTLPACDCHGHLPCQRNTSRWWAYPAYESRDSKFEVLTCTRKDDYIPYQMCGSSSDMCKPKVAIVEAAHEHTYDA